MPLRTPRTLWLDLPCDDDDCMNPAGLLAEGATKMATCQNHVFRLMRWLQEADSTEGACLVCEREDDTFEMDAGDYEATLCRGHALAFFSRTLTPDAYRTLVADAGGDAEQVFLLHSDFYTPAGRAWQPIPIGHADVRTRVQDMGAIPEFTEEGEYPSMPDLNALMKDGYRAATGLEIPDDLAESLVGEVLLTESLRRTAEEKDWFPSEEQRERSAARIQRIFQDLDPQGLVELGLEDDPYRREARDLSQRIHGSADETRDVIARRLLIDEAEMDLSRIPELAAQPPYPTLIDRLMDEVVEPLREERQQEGRSR